MDKKDRLDLSDDNGVTKSGYEIGILAETDYHDAMNAETYEKYFENICKRLKPRSVIIIDNASYHSRNDENYPLCQTGERPCIKSGCAKTKFSSKKMH